MGSSANYFSCICGIKMDTKISELVPKQGAATSADLIQQERVWRARSDGKSSAASSDEDRLAAGISTIGLLTKSAAEMEDEGGDLDGKETSRKNSFISG
jgi:hypothetical protein